MWLKDLQKYQFTICLLIGIFLSNINVDASVVKSIAESDGAANQQKEDVKLKEIKAAKKFKCPGMFGVFPDVEDCSKYYLCVAGISQRLPCPAFTHFDKYRKKCISMIIAICDKGKGGKGTTIPDKDISTVKDSKFSCPSILGSFPHSTDCSKYYKCTFFVPSLKTCPEHELFDGIKKECKPESEVNCGSRIRPTSESTLATTPFIPESTPLEVTTTLELTTPEATTTPEPTTPEVTTPEATTPEATTPEATTTTEPTTPEVSTPEPTTPVETTTMEEQTAPETDCDEDDLDCIITETGEIPKWFKCPVELGSHRHPSSNKLFIFCINWKPYVKKCGQDLIYSKELSTCVPP